MSKPPNYWDHFAHLQTELLAFIAEHGEHSEQSEPGVMPTTTALRAARRHDLLYAINTHGGFHAVAQRLGLQSRPPQKPHRYWRDPANLDRELLAFIAEQGEPSVMPTYDELIAHDRNDLATAIRRAGGFHVVAHRLGLQPRKNSSNHWADFATLGQAVIAFAAAQGHPGVMPTTSEILSAQRYDLHYAIQRHGGLIAVAHRLGLARPSHSPFPN